VASWRAAGVWGPNAAGPWAGLPAVGRCSSGKGDLFLAWALLVLRLGCVAAACWAALKGDVYLAGWNCQTSKTPI